MPDQYDIFISYGHLDDEDPDDDRGWVDLLVERLPGQVLALLGSKPTIWRDQHSLQGNHELEGAIRSGIARSLLFVPIFSPRYVTSEWCRRELELFCAAPPPPRVAGVDSFNTRIFKVVKSPLLFKHLSDNEPEQLRHLIGYPFYAMTENVPDLYSPDVVNGRDMRYWEQLRRLGLDIARMLVALKHGGAGPPTTTTPSVVVPAAAPAATNAAPTSPAAPAAANDAATAPASPTVVAAPAVVAGGVAPTKFVYLAETATDLAGERERVQDELRQRGYGVLPERKLPLEEVAKTVEAVRRDLQRSTLAVHLVGAKYGLAPEDDDEGRSIARIQEELAAEHERQDDSFLRILWTPAGLGAAGGIEVTDKRQREFVAGLQQRVTARAELLQSSVEELKTRVVEKLNPPAAASSSSASSRDARRRIKQVYLICEQRDRPLVRPIREYLFNRKFEVITWFDEGADEKLTDYHRKNLKECDAALIYFGNADEPWVRKNLDDLIKAYGYGREDDWAASAVYVGSPPRDEKEDFLTHKADVIRNVAGFEPDDLDEFVDAVEHAESGGGA